MIKPVLLLAFLAYTYSLNLVDRNGWGARPPLETKPLTETPTPFVLLHHGDSRRCTTEKECIKLVKAYQNYHMDHHHWEDIGYNFVIGEDGNAYTGRGWDNWGAHSRSYNNRSIGICIIGNFMNKLPNSKALDALNELITLGVQLGKIQQDYQFIGHRQTSNTLCPGDKLYNLLTTLPKWTVHPVDPFLTTTTTSTTTTTTSPSSSTFSFPNHQLNTSSNDLDSSWIRR